MITIESESLRQEWMSDAEFDRALTAGVIAAGTTWHEKIREQHFGTGAAARYGYEPRRGEPASGRNYKGSYAQRKQRKKGNIGPLRYSGRAYQESKNFRYKLTRVGREISIRISTPRVFNLRNPASRVRMAEEYQEVLVTELKSLVGAMVEKVGSAKKRKSRKR